MFLMSVLLSAIAFNPAMAPRPAMAGYVQAEAISPDKTCAPGAICAKVSMPNPRNGCFFNNFWNNSKGGTPLTIDVTETGGNGSPVYVYWINATSTTSISIKDKAYAKNYCPYS